MGATSWRQSQLHVFQQAGIVDVGIATSESISGADDGCGSGIDEADDKGNRLERVALDKRRKPY
jgi:hypothetical protein